ncbi:MAG TPA: SRPBCC domain-containing protein [Gammaproteobacteria bacterium]|nr:SRPBCC domain-containing protein [Gammaproteobacteria bacterium]
MNSRNHRLATLIALAGFAWCGSSAAGTIQQTIQFPGVAPEAIYQAYMSSQGHAAMTGFPATFYRPSTHAEVAVGQEGDELRAFRLTGPDGKPTYFITGTILKLVPGKEIVTSWRATAWDQGPKPGDGTDLACILVLTLRPMQGGTELQLVQVNIPDFPDVAASDAASAGVVSETAAVNSHWYFRYWAPMQKYFAAQAEKKSP